MPLLIPLSLSITRVICLHLMTVPVTLSYLIPSDIT